MKSFADQKIKDVVHPYLTVPVLSAMWIFSYISHWLYPLIGHPTSRLHEFRK